MVISKTRLSIRPSHPYLAHEVLAVDFGCAVCLQFDVGGGTGRLVGLWGVFRLVIGPLDPVASKLGQQNEWEGAAATENLKATGRSDAQNNTVFICVLHIVVKKMRSVSCDLYLMNTGIWDVILFCLQRRKQNMS